MQDDENINDSIILELNAEAYIIITLMSTEVASVYKIPTLPTGVTVVFRQGHCTL